MSFLGDPPQLCAICGNALTSVLVAPDAALPRFVMRCPCCASAAGVQALKLDDGSSCVAPPPPEIRRCWLQGYSAEAEPLRGSLVVKMTVMYEVKRSNVAKEREALDRIINGQGITGEVVLEQDRNGGLQMWFATRSKP